MSVLSSMDIIRSFKQGTVDRGGNCVSVALIKATIDVFRLEQVFVHHRDGDVHNVQLRDGNRVTFTDQELTTTTQRADFRLLEGDTPEQTDLFCRIHRYANICFCTMVKRTMGIGESGQGLGDFEAAIAAVNGGANTRSIPKLLGITKVYGPKLWMRTSGRKGVLAWRGGHTVFASNGWYDGRGIPRRVGILFPRRMQILA